jgi:fatty-acyl-CoA synthase
VPGDHATVAADGTVRLLGRGSACINTGGEKVFPEEVEAEIRKHPSVFDCLVVGVPDDRFGERVVALVQLADGHELDEPALTEFCRRHLARYKAPRRFLAVGSLDRSAAGKANYQAMRVRAVELLTADTD